MTPATQSALDQLWSDGRAAWPEIALDRSRFDAHVAPLVESAVADGGVELFGADLYLACACALANTEALAAFDRAHLGQVGAFLSRIDGSAAFVDEVRQILRERLFVASAGARPKIADYSGRGALGSWVRVVAIRTALSLRRGPRNRAGEHFGGDEAHADTMLVSPDPEIHYIKARYRAAFEEAFQAALSALGSQERTILRLHFLDGLNIDKIGALYQVHRATVARWIGASRQTLLDDTRRRLRDRLRLSTTEFESLMGLVQSQLDVSLHGALKSTSG